MRALFILIVAGLSLQGTAQEYTWTPQVSGTSQWLNDITFTDLMHGCAVGTTGAIISTENGGESWITRTSGTTEELRSVFFLNQDTGWATGGTGQPVLLQTSDGGINWTPVDADLPGALFLRDIEFTDALHGYAISADQIYRTSNGGLTWEPGSYSSLVASILDLEDLDVISESAAFVAGRFKEKSNESLPGIFENLSLMNGQWLPQGSGGFDSDDTLTALCFTESRTGFSGSTSGKVYVMRVEGSAFPRPWALNFDTEKGRVHSIVFPSDMNGMFNVTGEDGGQEMQFIYHTADTGSTWSTDPDMVPDMMTGTLAAPDVNHAWIAGSNGKIFKGVRVDPLSVKSLETVTLKVRPNPFNAVLVIESSLSLQEARFELLDLTGKIIRSGQMGNASERFTLTGLGDLHNGIYLLRIRSSGSQLMTSQKIVKY